MADVKFLQINNANNIYKETYNDIEFDNTNSVVEIHDTNYVVQAIGKVLKTTKNIANSYPNYGTNINNIRVNVVGNVLLESAVTTDILAALAYIKTLEQSPLVTENIIGVSSITAAVAATTSGNTLNIIMTVVTEKGTSVTITI